MTCSICNNTITPTLRVELGYTTCLNCAEQQTTKYKGYMSYHHKTAAEVQVVGSEQFNHYRHYQPYGKNTGRGSGVQRMLTKVTKLK